MDCTNHPGILATARCAGCAEPFCDNCVVNIGGQTYCGACKTMAVAGAPMVDVATIPCKEANEALTYAIVGLFCLGIILEPIAIVKANQARKLLKLNPRLSGSGKITATYIIAGLGFLFSLIWLIGIVTRHR